MQEANWMQSFGIWRVTSLDRHLGNRIGNQKGTALSGGSILVRPFQNCDALDKGNIWDDLCSRKICHFITLFSFWFERALTIFTTLWWVKEMNLQNLQVLEVCPTMRVRPCLSFIFLLFGVLLNQAGIFLNHFWTLTALRFIRKIEILFVTLFWICRKGIRCQKNQNGDFGHDLHENGKF